MSESDSTSLTAIPQDSVGERRVEQIVQARRKRKTAQEPPSSPPPVKISVEVVEPEQLTVIERFKRWIHSPAFAGYSISVMVHFLALLLMSVVIVTEIFQEDFIQTSFETTEEDNSLEDVVDVRIDMSAGDVSTTQSLETAMNLEAVPDVNNPILTGVEDSLENLLDVEGNGGDGGASFLVPKNVKVFAKGSFTAWTEPNDPVPGRDYKIIILVKLPDRVTRYRASDLSGIVIGTDGYRQPIPGPEYKRGSVYLPIKDRHAQLEIKVPGAASRVRDSIEIRSTTLKEKQLLEIEF